MTTKTNKTNKQEIPGKKPTIPLPNNSRFNFKGPSFNRGPSFKTAFKTQNKGGK